MKRRDFIKTALMGCMVPLGLRTSSGHAKSLGAQIVVLGFDGVDPRLVRTWIRSGDLPNMARLEKTGCLMDLGSTNPPNSPVAWSTFATGRSPLEHGIFGFLQRNPDNYLPAIAPYAITGPSYPNNGVKPPHVRSFRKGAAFWDTMDSSGIPVTLLSVPYAYPPPKLQNGRVLAGLGVPDLRFTNSSFTLYTSEKLSQKQSRVAGGRLVFLSGTGTRHTTSLEGPLGPDGKYLQMDLHLEVDKRNRTVVVSIGGQRERLRKGQRSNWFRVVFRAKELILAGRVRFRLLSIKNELRLYASPIQIGPNQPALSLGNPANWLSEALEKHPQVPTLGWAHDTSAVNAGALPKDAFLEDLLTTMHARTDLLLDELNSGFARVLVAVFTGTDRASHIFFKNAARPDGGPLLAVYKTMDDIVGKISARLTPGSRLIVMSDHGFHSFDRMLHTNTWLEAQGLFFRRKPNEKVSFLRGVDWSQTKAYSIDTGQVYINLKGREAEGCVRPGPEYKALVENIRARLLDLKDPKTGKHPVRSVYEVAKHASLDVRRKAPDLQIGFIPGYRGSWETSLGGAPIGGFMAPNPKAWRADHAASDFNETPGFIMTNTKLKHQHPNLLDFAPSLLHELGLPASGSGKLLFS